MSNDPKDAIIDLSKMTTRQQPITTQSIPVSTSPSMITLCNEGANLIDVETSTQNGRMIGHEIFTKNEAGKKNP